MSNNAHELSNRLLNALDNNYNVVDMRTVNEIISILEKFNITKELLETTRLGKHVNELRRKTSDPTLARRAKVLVKRWRDLVIPTVASPGHTGSNRSSAERTVRRLGGTPLTSPALSRIVSPAVSSPRPPSRPAWGGYESDSQDVILVDDEPPPPLPPPPPPPLLAGHKPLTPPVKRPPSLEPVVDDKKAKRDKKPKKRRSHSRAGSGMDTGGVTTPAPATGVGGTAAGGGGTAPWRDRNGTGERRRNGCRKDTLDPYTAMVNRIPVAGAKKVKTTQELLEEIQSRGSKQPASPASPDVLLIEPDSFPVKSPLRNGAASPRPPSPQPPSPRRPPLEDAREYHECTCGDEPLASCPAARQLQPRPLHVRALHAAWLPGVNGTRAPPRPHQFAVRPAPAARPGLFATVVPLYKYSDYADDYCAKNMDAVPLCTHLPWTEFAPPPPDLPPPPSPPPIRPYPVDEPEDDRPEVSAEPDGDEGMEANNVECAKIEPEMIGVPELEPSDRLKAPILTPEDESQFGKSEPLEPMEVEEQFQTESRDHRTVERTKERLDGRGLFDLCRRIKEGIPYDYSQIHSAPVVPLPEDEAALEQSLAQAARGTARDPLGRPPRPASFTEWHECAQLGDLVALPYVVID